MTYREALDWIYAFSDTERTGAFRHDREDNLRRERALLAALGNPQLAYPVTHIAGTKGKGSTAAMVASILRATGLRVGLYTQPDLHTFRERMQLDGVPISETMLERLVAEVRTALARVDKTVGSLITYEIATALALLYFQRAGAQHAVVEVGLGGRLDATNVVNPRVAVITSISYDHMQVLGTTLSAIAGEKAGIIKPGVPTVCSAQAPEARAVIAATCAQRQAPLISVGPAGSAQLYTYQARTWDGYMQTFDVFGPMREYRDLELRLLGAHQLENATAAVATVETLHARGTPVSQQAIRDGLRQAVWPARLQLVGERPLVLVDGAHNADSLARLFAALVRHFSYDRLVLVLGVMADKDVAGMAREVASATTARIGRLVTTAAAFFRSLDPARLAQALTDAAPALPVDVTATVPEALAGALRAAGPRDCVCVAGSLYVAAEALRWFAAEYRPGGAAVVYPPTIDGVDH